MWENKSEVVKEIPISGGYVALVDDEDYERLAAYKGYAAKGRRGAIYAARGAIYAARGAKRRKPNGKWQRFGREMQRDVLDPEMKLPGSIRSDHINHNTLDNRRDNLRLVDDHVSNVNRRLFKNNRSGYRGVHYFKDHNRFRAQVSKHGSKHIGPYRRTLREAIMDYNELAARHHGEHATFHAVPEE